MNTWEYVRVDENRLGKFHEQTSAEIYANKYQSYLSATINKQFCQTQEFTASCNLVWCL